MALKIDFYLGNSTAINRDILGQLQVQGFRNLTVHGLGCCDVSGDKKCQI